MQRLWELCEGLDLGGISLGWLYKEGDVWA